MSEERKNDRDVDPEPWHVPQISPHAPADELPPEVEAAARRAFGARRPGVAVADLSVPHLQPDGESSQYSFGYSGVSIDFMITEENGGLRLRISCSAAPAANVDVMHGGDTKTVTLDENGIGESDVQPGPLSVLFPSAEGFAAVQTAWVRIR